MFVALLYMFWATICSSSGENTVPMKQFHSALRTRQSST